MTWYFARRWFVSNAAVMVAMLASVNLIFLPQFAAGYALCSLLLIPAVSRRDVSRLHLSLPIPARDIVFGRMIGIGSVMLVPLLCWLLSVGVRGLPLDTLFLVEVILVGTLTVVVPEAFQASLLAKPSRAITTAALVSPATTGVLVIRFLPTSQALPLLSIALLVAAIVVQRRIPPSIALTPMRLDKARAETPRRAAMFIPRSSSPWWLLIGKELLTTQIVLQWGFALLGGVVGRISWMSAMSAMTLSTQIRARTRWLEPLPLSLRARVLILVVPAVFVTAVLGAIGHHVGIPGMNASYSMGKDSPSTPYGDRYFSSDTRVPLAFWHVAPNGVTPRIVSPFGESVEPYTLSVAGVLLFNPYSSREESSPQFVAWQFARATSVVYGQALTLKEYEKASGANALPPTVLASLRIWILGVAAFVTFLLLLLWLSELVRHPSANIGISQNFMGFISHFPMILLVLFDTSYVFRRQGYVFGPLVQKVLLELSLRLPSNTVLVSLLALLPVLAMYALFEWQFAQSETTERIAPPPA